MITVEMLDKIAGRTVRRSNAGALLAGLSAYPAGLDKPHRLAQFIAQVMHESLAFTYDEEVWGPTPAQKKYEGRSDLGNTQPGDGYAFRGRSAIQLTGRANYAAFRDWCRARVQSVAPNFETDPDLVRTDPWEGLAPVWFWDSRALNRFADEGNIEMITRRINGGLNGYDDRCRYYTRAALVMLGFDPDEVRDFQGIAGLVADGIPGPKTRTELHMRLLAIPAPADTIATLAARVAALEAAVTTLAARLP